MHLNSPLIRVLVNKADVDSIDIYSEVSWGWKIQGWKAGELAVPDQVQDQFHGVINDLVDYVDDSSVWLNADTGEQITCWQAMVMLTVCQPAK